MHTLAQLCVRRPVFATMLILSLVVVGIFSYFSLGVDLFPKVDIPTVVVIIANPGASPEEIETEITKKVEDAVNTISRWTRCAPPLPKASRWSSFSSSCPRTATWRRRKCRTRST